MDNIYATLTLLFSTFSHHDLFHIPTRHGLGRPCFHHWNLSSVSPSIILFSISVFHNPWFHSIHLTFYKLRIHTIKKYIQFLECLSLKPKKKCSNLYLFQCLWSDVASSVRLVQVTHPVSIVCPVFLSIVLLSICASVVHLLSGTKPIHPGTAIIHDWTRWKNTNKFHQMGKKRQK